MPNFFCTLPFSQPSWNTETNYNTHIYGLPLQLCSDVVGSSKYLIIIFIFVQNQVPQNNNYYANLKKLFLCSIPSYTGALVLLMISWTYYCYGVFLLWLVFWLLDVGENQIANTACIHRCEISHFNSNGLTEPKPRGGLVEMF